MSNKLTRDMQYMSMLDQANLLGRIAGNRHTPTPMNVVQADVFGRPLPGAEVYHVPQGMCGFAWVTIKPGTHPFAKWLKQRGYAHKGYYGGVEISIQEYNQSVERKYAHAVAMASYLRDNGIEATAHERLD